MTETISKWLPKIGITVKSTAFERGTLDSVMLGDRDFDMAITETEIDIDPAAMYWWYGCWAADAGISAGNLPGYCNEEMDKLIKEYWYSPDKEKRWEPMWKAQEIFNHDRPLILLAGQNLIQAYRNDRFEFPSSTCDVSAGMASKQGLLNVIVK
jgi:ABC-type transport system substrate-binding protein